MAPKSDQSQLPAKRKRVKDDAEEINRFDFNTPELNTLQNNVHEQQARELPTIHHNPSYPRLNSANLPTSQMPVKPARSVRDYATSPKAWERIAQQESDDSDHEEQLRQLRLTRSKAADAVASQKAQVDDFGHVSGDILFGGQLNRDSSKVSVKRRLLGMTTEVRKGTRRVNKSKPNAEEHSESDTSDLVPARKPLSDEAVLASAFKKQIQHVTEKRALTRQSRKEDHSATAQAKGDTLKRQLFPSDEEDNGGEAEETGAQEEAEDEYHATGEEQSEEDADGEEIDPSEVDVPVISEPKPDDDLYGLSDEEAASRGPRPPINTTSQRTDPPIDEYIEHIFDDALNNKESSDIVVKKEPIPEVIDLTTPTKHGSHTNDFAILTTPAKHGSHINDLATLTFYGLRPQTALTELRIHAAEGNHRRTVQYESGPMAQLLMLAPDELRILMKGPDLWEVELLSSSSKQSSQKVNNNGSKTNSEARPKQQLGTVLSSVFEQQPAASQAKQSATVLSSSSKQQPAASQAKQQPPGTSSLDGTKSQPSQITPDKGRSLRPRTDVTPTTQRILGGTPSNERARRKQKELDDLEHIWGEGFLKSFEAQGLWHSSDPVSCSEEILKAMNSCAKRGWQLEQTVEAVESCIRERGGKLMKLSDLAKVAASR